MPITTAGTANTLLNTVAAEVGLTPATDPWASNEPQFVQMRVLLQLVGEELCWLGEWEHLNRSHSITTAVGDTGLYDLPSDYLTMIQQTGWELSNNTPLLGPLSPQDWAYLKGRDLVSQSIYANFRLQDGKFSVFPQPPPAGLVLDFEYRANTFVQDPTTPDVKTAIITNGADIILFDKTLVSRYLKVKWLEAKGFDSTKAQDDVNMMFGLVQPADGGGGKILSAGRSRRGFPYLNSRYNVRDTGYGN